LKTPKEKLEANKKYQKTEKGKASLRRAQLKYLYGITQEQYNQLFHQQNGQCGICGGHQSKLNRVLSVDHNHKTGEVRGLLCRECNVVLGHIEKRIKNLDRIKEYLNNI